MSQVFFLRDIRPVLARALLLTMVAAAAGIFYVRTTFASYTTPTPSCYDIVGSGKGVSVGGVNNSGIVTFDPIGGNPLYQYEACAIDPDDDPTTGLFEIHGWAWDDNLGWISFYCPPGVGATNEGIACSNASYTGGYGVKVDPVTGKFSGYAWGDNVGWISFDNPGFSTVKTDATNPKCQGYVYSTVKPDPSCPAHTKADTAAWSDNVGWLDFDGILLPWYSLIAEINDAGVQVSLTPDPSTLDMNTAPLANDNVTGTDKYTLLLHIQDKKGNPVEYGPGDRYTVTATPEWAFDTVKKDQTHSGAPLVGAACPGGALQNAVTKPCATGDMVYQGAGTGNASAVIKSVAPTSNTNGWDKDGDGVMDFSYEGFTLPSSLSIPPQSNRLVLQDVLVKIVDNNAGGACVYGTGGTCTPKAKVPTYADPSKPDLKFRPRTNVTKLEDYKGNTDFIEIGGSAPWPFPTTITGPGTVTFTAGIEPVPSPHDYDFLFDTDASTVLENPGDLATKSLTAGTTPLSAGLGAVIDPDTKAAKPVPAFVPGLYMYSTVSETGGVQYYSNKFPKTIGSVAVTPVAVLKGNIYSSGAAATTVGQAIRSLGDVSTNILRDTIFRNVSKIIAGVQKPADRTLVELLPTADKKGFYDRLGPGGNLTPLLPDDSGNSKVYLHYGNLSLNSLSGPISWDGERTIIVIGGSVSIAADIYNDPSSYTGAKPKLGIIVLKDLTDKAEDQKTQGHVYIDPSVIHIQANIFADGSVFSAPVTPSSSPMVAVNSDGEPTYAASITTQEDTLKYNQLFIEGSLASQNTVGGAQQSPPITGTGVKATWSDPTLQARLYDLNFLRYYTGVLKRNGSGVPLCGSPPTPVASEADVKLIKTDGSGTPWTVYDSPAGCLFSPVDPASGKSGYHSAFSHTGTPYEDYVNLGATYIYFDPPTPTLPGFSTEGGATQKQLPQ